MEAVLRGGRTLPQDLPETALNVCDVSSGFPRSHEVLGKLNGPYRSNQGQNTCGPRPQLSTRSYPSDVQANWIEFDLSSHPKPARE